ncbi:MAG: 30S ribosomal protein S4 [Nitrospirota bacterium]
MARQTESVCRLCRREGLKLFLKGQRCYTEKCAIDRRAYPPGQQGQARPRFSEYGQHLREKQKLKRFYGLLETQFRNYFERASRMKGATGENLLLLLERRLDNVVYRMGLASSRAEARQWIRHRHVLVNGRIVDIPAFLVRPGNVMELKEKSRELSAVQRALAVTESHMVPGWLRVDRAHGRGEVTGLPTRDDIDLAVNEKLVVEFYSR